MLSVLQRIERSFVLCFTLAVILGVALPGVCQVLNRPGIMVALGFVLFNSFLKIEIREVFGHVKRPGLIAWILVVNLLLLPLLVWLLSWPLSLPVRMGLVLLAALPTGVAATAITGLLGGRMSLTLLLCLLSSLLAPVTIPLLFYLLFGTRLRLDYLQMTNMLGLMILIPLGLAQATRRWLPGPMSRIQPYFGGVGVLALSLIIASVLAGEAATLRGYPLQILGLVAILHVLFAGLQLAGYFTAPGLTPAERLALSVNKSVMNNALGILLAVSFFPPLTLVVLVLSEIPWSLAPALYRFFPRPVETPERGSGVLPG